MARDPAPVAEPGATVEEIRALRRSSGRSPWWLLALGAPVLGAVVVGGVALAWWVVPGVGQTPHATEIADLRPGPVAPLPGPALGGGAGEVDPPEVAPPAAVAVRADPDPPAVDPVPKGRPAPVRPAVAAVGAGGDAATPSPARPDPDPPGTAEPVDPVPPEPPPPETVAVVLPVPTPRPFPSLGVTGVSADRVSLRNPERRFFWPGDPLPPDTYEILLDDAYIAGRVRVDAGMASVSVHCVPELKECR